MPGGCDLTRFPDGSENTLAYAFRLISPAEKNYRRFEKEEQYILYLVVNF